MPKVWVGVVVEDELLALTGVYYTEEEADVGINEQLREMELEGYEPEGFVMESVLRDD